MSSRRSRQILSAKHVDLKHSRHAKRSNSGRRAKLSPKRNASRTTLCGRRPGSGGPPPRRGGDRGLVPSAPPERCTRRRGLTLANDQAAVVLNNRARSSAHARRADRSLRLQMVAASIQSRATGALRAPGGGANVPLRTGRSPSPQPVPRATCREPSLSSARPAAPRSSPRGAALPPIEGKGLRGARPARAPAWWARSACRGWCADAASGRRIRRRRAVRRRSPPGRARRLPRG